MSTGIEILDRLSGWEGRVGFKLETPRRLLALLGNPQDKIKTVHVAGTNGKGSVCSYISAMLLKSGFSVGQFSSPHIVSVTERCFINACPCEFEQYKASVENCWKIAVDNKLEPSFFELTAATAFCEFANRNLDYGVIEVGLGGRLDVTNLITKPEVSVITTIGIDHTNLLGTTIPQIAREKAGIIKQGVPVVVGRVSESADKVISQVAENHKAPLYRLGREFSYEAATGKFSFNDLQWTIHPKEIALNGLYQFDNAAVSLCVAALLGLSEDKAREGLSAVKWPGRLELFQNHRLGHIPILLDAAHNEDGVRELCRYLESYCKKHRELKKICIVCSVLNTKAWQIMLGQIRKFSDELMSMGIKTDIVFTSSKQPHAVSPQELVKLYKAGRVEEDPKEAIQSACQDTTNSLVVVAGSIYLLGQVRPLITTEPVRTM